MTKPIGISAARYYAPLVADNKPVKKETEAKQVPVKRTYLIENKSSAIPQYSSEKQAFLDISFENGVKIVKFNISEYYDYTAGPDISSMTSNFCYEFKEYPDGRRERVKISADSHDTYSTTGDPWGAGGGSRTQSGDDYLKKTKSDYLDLITKVWGMEKNKNLKSLIKYIHADLMKWEPAK